MANDEHVALLKQGIDAWNLWRDQNPSVFPDLSRSDLTQADLRFANLSGANLSEARLTGPQQSPVIMSLRLLGADLKDLREHGADLSGANLRGANLRQANLRWAILTDADLTQADLRWAELLQADLSYTNLAEANLIGANLSGSKLREANLSQANLHGANLNSAKLIGATLRHADLRSASLVETDFTDADLSGCHIFGVSAWRLKLEGAKQQNLVVTTDDEPAITVDDIEVAQFIYLMLYNGKIRGVIETITSKAVLILGRFTPERKQILDALRDALRRRDYLPILFDFDVPTSRDMTETISLLAHMVRFIIADLTEPSSVPKELEAIVPHLAVPVQPVIEGSDPPYAMFKDYWKYEWVLPVYRYNGLSPLLMALTEKVIGPAEARAKELQERRPRSSAS